MLEQNPFLWQELARQRQRLLLYETQMSPTLRVLGGPKRRRPSLREALASLLIHLGLRLQGSQGPWRCMWASESKASYHAGCHSHRRAVL